RSAHPIGTDRRLRRHPSPAARAIVTARHVAAHAHGAHAHAPRRSRAPARGRGVRAHPVFHRAFARTIRSGLEGILVLPAGAAIGLVWANLAPESYFSLAQRLTFAVNEIGMAFFFALLAQEVLEAVMPGGALHSWRRWSLPLVAAAGGAAGAVGAYLVYVQRSYEAPLFQAWPIACAIDAAATYYIVKAILPR